MRRIGIVFIVVVAGAIGYLIAIQTRQCRRVVTDDAEFIHLDNHSIVILSPDMMARLFGKSTDDLTLFYGSNRMLTDKGERAIAKVPLLPMSKSVRALFFSGDDWPDLVVPVHALETREQVVLRINLQTHKLHIGERRQLTSAQHTVTREGLLVVTP